MRPLSPCTFRHSGTSPQTASSPAPLTHAGEWRNNLKEGRGVYRFPKGGLYEGEWRGGKMEGLGVRTYASGRVQVRASQPDFHAVLFC